MPAQNATCPPDAALHDFGLGKLDAASAETVSRHLEKCGECRQRVAGVTGDSFVGRLKQAGKLAQPAQRREHTYVPGESVANTASSTDGSLLKESRRAGISRPSRKDADTQKRDGPGGPSSVAAPPELADHPDYELVKQLGQGGMGTVYLAKNRMMDRQEVLKVISKSLLDRPGALERFQQEIRSAAKLAHPNIVAAYSVLRPGDLLVFAMEYVRGQDLSQVVKARGYLPVANAAFYIHQVANGLQHAFEKGMVHRDIKPNNLMLAIEGKKHTVKILDFGLAKATSEKGEERGLTKSGQMLGTPDYVAPEQTLDAHKADIRADIYSLGCTLYFLLSGGPPFPETSVYATLEAHHKREPKPLNLVRPDVSVELAAVVAKMMAKDPARRYQTPGEVAKALVPFFKPGQSVAAASQLESPEAESATAVPQASAAPAQSLPTAVIPLAVAAPLPAAAVHPPREFSLTIDTHRPAPRRRGGWPALPPWQRWAAMGGGAALVLLGVVFLLQTKDGTMRVEINDPQIEVAIKGTDIVLKQADSGHDVKLSPGQKTLIVERGDFRFETDKLVLKTRETVAVAVTLLDGRIEVKQGKRLIGRDKLPPSAAGRNGNARKRFAFDVAAPQRARWSLDGAELVQSSLDRDSNIYFGDSDWEDIDFSVEAKMVSGNHMCVMWFRYVDGDNADLYALGADGNATHLAQSNSEGRGTKTATRRGSLAADKWYRLELRVRGRRGECYLDGERILDFETDRAGRGRVGLGTWGAAYRFRNIVVKAPDGRILLEGLPDLERANTASGGGSPQKASSAAKRFTCEIPERLRSEWSIDGNELVRRSTEGDPMLTFGNSIQGDYDFSVEAKRLKGNHVFVLLFGFENEDKHFFYGLGAWSGRHDTGRIIGGRFEYLGSRQGTLTQDRWYHAEVRVRGEKCECFLDGEKLFDFTSNGLHRGNFGLLVRASAYRFRNILIKSPDGKILLQGLPDLDEHQGVNESPGSSETEPAQAVAPFDAKQARAHQQAWAKHLGVQADQNNSIGMKLKLIPPGEFMMGNTPGEIDAVRKSTKDRNLQGWYGAEGPQHRVTLTKPFYLGSYEVTQAEYKDVMGVNPSHFAPGRPGEAVVKGLDVTRHPVDTVSWPDAIEFCNKLSVKEGLPEFYARDGDKVTTLATDGYRLPTEAEWEYACRAGSPGRWSFGDDESELPKYAWFAPNSGGRPHAVGELAPNAFGLYDMHGNCTEWVWDLFGGYSASAAADPTGAAASSGRMARGGTFTSPPFEVRAAGRRESAVPGYKAYFNSFRVARTVGVDGAAPAEANTGPVDRENKAIATSGVPKSQVWSKFISASTIEDEVKAQAGPVAELIKIPAVFKGGGNHAARIRFTEVAMLFGIISQYDGDVRWKRQALGFREIFRRAAVNCKVGTDNSFKEAHQRGDDLARLIAGEKVELPKADSGVKWAEVANRPPLMARMGKEGYNAKIKTWTTDKGEFSKSRNALLEEAQIMATIAHVIQDPSYEFSDDEAYLGYAQDLEKQALEIAEAAKADNLARAQTAARQLSKSCSSCHENFR